MDEDMYDDEWGCDYCRNDGRLDDKNCCPVCDAQYFDLSDVGK